MLEGEIEGLLVLLGLSQVGTGCDYCSPVDKLTCADTTLVLDFQQKLLV